MIKVFRSQFSFHEAKVVNRIITNGSKNLNFDLFLDPFFRNTHMKTQGDARVILLFKICLVVVGLKTLKRCLHSDWSKIE